jgi:hypothetical protein
VYFKRSGAGGEKACRSTDADYPVTPTCLLIEQVIILRTAGGPPIWCKETSYLNCGTVVDHFGTRVKGLVFRF